MAVDFGIIVLDVVYKACEVGTIFLKVQTKQLVYASCSTIVN